MSFLLLFVFAVHLVWRSARLCVTAWLSWSMDSSNVLVAHSISKAGKRSVICLNLQYYFSNVIVLFDKGCYNKRRERGKEEGALKERGWKGEEGQTERREGWWKGKRGVGRRKGDGQKEGKEVGRESGRVEGGKG